MVSSLERLLTQLRPHATFFRRCPAGFYRLRFYPAQPAANPKATPFFLVHGLGVSAGYFERLISELTVTNPVYTIDLPGFGGVPRADATLQIESLAQVLASALQQFTPSGAHLLGHSMGAQVALEAALGTETNLISLTLLGLPAQFEHFPKLRLLARFLRSSLHEPAGLLGTAALSYLQCGLRNFAAAAPAVAHYPALSRLADSYLHFPVTVLRGEFDFVASGPFTKKFSQALINHCERVSVASCDGQAHSVLYEADEWLAAVTLQTAGIEGPSLAQRLRGSAEGDESPSAARTTTVIRELWDDANSVVRELQGEEPPARWQRAGDKPPVVVIPGINETWRAFEPILEKLNRAGHRIVTVPELGRLVPEPQVLADLVWQRTQALQLPSFQILAHSKGGLVARALMRTPERAGAVQRVVTVGTPFAGSPWGWLFPRWSQIGRLSPGARFFSTSDGSNFPADKFRVIQGDWDPKLLGPSHLEGAQHFRLRGGGHSLPLRQAALHSLVLQLLEP